MNLTNTIIPRSDQLNADDLLCGPITIRVSAVEAGSSTEQPVTIRYEFDNGRPYKPCKSMRRVLVALWGTDGAAYIGRKLTLYCDKAVTFGPDTTGGIRISHASDIQDATEIALTVKRGKRRPFRVKPLIEQPAQDFGFAPGWSRVEQGEHVSRKGIEVLRAWWDTLSKEEKTTLKPKLDGEWKANALAKGAAQ